MYKVIRLTFNFKEFIHQKTLLLLIATYKKVRDSFYAIIGKLLENVIKQQFLEGNIAIIVSGGSVFLISPSSVTDVHRRDFILTTAKGLLLMQGMFIGKSKGTKEAELFKNALFSTLELPNVIAQAENQNNIANSKPLFTAEVQSRLSDEWGNDGMLTNTAVDRSTPEFGEGFLGTKSTAYRYSAKYEIYRPADVSNVDCDFATTQYCIHPVTKKVQIMHVLGDFKHKLSGNFLEPKGISMPYPQIILPRVIVDLQRRCVWFEKQLKEKDYSPNSILAVGYKLLHDRLEAMRNGTYTFEDACYYHYWNQTLPELYRTKVHFPINDFYPKNFLKPEYKELHEFSLAEFGKIKLRFQERLAAMSLEELHPELRKVCQETNFNNLTNTTLLKYVKFTIAEYGNGLLADDRPEENRFEVIKDYALINEFPTE